MAVRTLRVYVCIFSRSPGGGRGAEDGGGGLRSVAWVVRGVLLYVSRCWGFGN